MEKLTDKEVDAMMAIWNSEHTLVPTGEILRHVNNRAKRNSLQTLQVVLRRLCEKGAVQCEKGKQTNFYCALIDEKDYLKFATENFIRHHFHGSVKMSLQFQLHNMPITGTEINEIVAILQDFQDDQ